MKSSCEDQEVWRTSHNNVSSHEALLDESALQAGQNNRDRAGDRRSVEANTEYVKSLENEVERLKTLNILSLSLDVYTPYSYNYRCTVLLNSKCCFWA